MMTPFQNCPLEKRLASYCNERLCSQSRVLFKPFTLLLKIALQDNRDRIVTADLLNVHSTIGFRIDLICPRLVL